MNAWVLADPRGYMWNWELYTGKKGQTESGLTKNVVLSLCRPIFGNGRTIRRSEIGKIDTHQKIGESDACTDRFRFVCGVTDAFTTVPLMASISPPQ